MAVTIPKGLPRVFSYDDYRAFLRDWYRAEKRGARRFSYGVFARRAGIASRSHFNNVVQGRVNLSPKFADRYARGMRLAPEEAEYFRLLVAATQARTSREREERLESLRGWLWRRREGGYIHGDPADLVRAWPRLLVRSLLREERFRADPQWISRRLQGRITVRQAAEALDYLERGGCIRRKGRRLAWHYPYGASLLEGDGDASSARILRSALRDAGDRRRSPDGFLVLHTMLSKADAKRFRERMRRAAIEALPRDRSLKAKGELHAVLLDVLPLTGRSS